MPRELGGCVQCLQCESLDSDSLLFRISAYYNISFGRRLPFCSPKESREGSLSTPCTCIYYIGIHGLQSPSVGFVDSSVVRGFHKCFSECNQQHTRIIFASVAYCLALFRCVPLHRRTPSMTLMRGGRKGVTRRLCQIYIHIIHIIYKYILHIHVPFNRNGFS